MKAVVRESLHVSCYYSIILPVKEAPLLEVRLHISEEVLHWVELRGILSIEQEDALAGEDAFRDHSVAVYTSVVHEHNYWSSLI